MLDDVADAIRFVRRLPAFLRHPATDAARGVLADRLATREARFRAFFRDVLVSRPGSPYHGLLAAAGCEPGDLDALVRREGIEGALGRLLAAGAYLTVEEFKGRRPVVRGSTRLQIGPAALSNPLASRHLLGQSSGSRGARTPVPNSLEWIHERGVDTRLALEARGGAGWQHAIWMVPGSTAVTMILRYARFGLGPARWFAQVDPRSPSLHPRYRWSGRLLRWTSVLAGVPVPRPEHVPLDDPTAIVEWMRGVLRGGATPHLDTFASAAVRVCLAAEARGLDLAGAQFSLEGEPTTAARLAVIRRVGAAALPQYAATGSGPIGLGCLAPVAPDDVHVQHDLHALVTAPRSGPEDDVGDGVRSLFISTFSRAAPFVLLNVSLGDQAVLEERACGCPIEALGFTTHLRSIRSFEKLTAGGLTLLDVDVGRVLEEVLPGRFGGAPTDYQLVEDEGADGVARLRLVVHPRVGPAAPERLRETFLAALGQGRGGDRVTTLAWREGHMLAVERRVPYRTSNGKILHVHLERAPGRPSSLAASAGGD
jgi:hypothetical protein